jgi:NitT/TauT family transport system ATP-binding protein
LTPVGSEFVELDVDERKAMFAQQMLRHVPLAAHMHEVLVRRGEHRAKRIRFEDELEDHMNHREAEATMQSFIGWGRFAELFNYDSRSRTFSIRAEAAASSANAQQPTANP